MRRRRTGMFAIAFWLGLLVSGMALAQEEPSEARRREASDHFQRGVALFQEGAFRAALVEFERANEIAPDYRLLYNIGQTRLQLQDYLGAMQAYEEYLAKGGADIPGARREDVERAFEILRERVARIGVRVNEDGAEVFIDERKVGVAPMASTVTVNVGRHRVYARSPDGAEDSKVVDVAGGDLIEVSLELIAPKTSAVVVASEKRPPMSTKRIIAIASWALGGVALGVAVYTGTSAQGKVDDREKELDKPLPDRSKANDLESSANTLAITTDVLAGVSLAAVATGIYLWVTSDPTDEPDAEVKTGAHLQWGPGFGGLSWGGRF